MLWSRLAARLSVPIPTGESVWENRGGIIGGEMRGDRRRPGSVIHRSLLVLDTGKTAAMAHPTQNEEFHRDPREKHGTGPPFEVLWERLLQSGNACCLFSLEGLTDENQQWRLVWPLKNPIQAEAYETFARIVAQTMGISMPDESLYHTGSMMRWPTLPIDGNFFFAALDGPWLDPNALTINDRNAYDQTELAFNPSKKKQQAHPEGFSPSVSFSKNIKTHKWREQHGDKT